MKYKDYYSDPQGLRSEKYQTELRKCKTKLFIISKEQNYEAMLRHEHKGLQNAWEQYQLMLKLVKG